MKYITVIFKNAIQIEGSLISLDDNKMVLQSLDGIGTQTVIPDVRESVLFYKVNPSKELYDQLAEKPYKTQEDLEQLVRARGDLLAIEKIAIGEKLRSPGTINVINKPIEGSQQHSQTKATRTNTQFAQGLQRVFSKEH